MEEKKSDIKPEKEEEKVKGEEVDQPVVKKKGPYTAPKIEVHKLDNTISLIMSSFSDPGGDKPPFEASQKGDGINGTDELFSDNPFGGNRPEY